MSLTTDISDPVGLGLEGLVGGEVGLRIFTFNKLSGDADTAGLRDQALGTTVLGVWAVKSGLPAC